MEHDGQIRSIDIDKDVDGTIREVRIVFGPHYFLEVRRKAGRVEFVLGATHHGFRADASSVAGELEKVIEAVRRDFPKFVVD